jgi:hypothetical protein
LSPDVLPDSIRNDQMKTLRQGNKNRYTSAKANLFRRCNHTWSNTEAQAQQGPESHEFGKVGALDDLINWMDMGCAARRIDVRKMQTLRPEGSVRGRKRWTQKSS